MKKSLTLFIFLLFTSILSARQEYVNDRQCIYQVDTYTREASVVCYLTYASPVVIPESFVYLNDRYRVTTLSKVDFTSSRYIDSKYYGYKDDDVRSRITSLVLPKSITDIGYYGLAGFSRLKEITIPQHVTYAKGSAFRGDERLVSIHFLGLCAYDCDDFPSRTIYPTNPTEFIRDIKEDLKEHSSCYSLKTVTVSGLEYFQHLASVNQQLLDHIDRYNQLLAQNPYNIYDITISPHSIDPLPRKDNKRMQQMYDETLKAIRTEYQNKQDSMEWVCHKENPDTFITIYMSLHPEFVLKVDSIYHDYKCRYTKLQIGLMLLDGDQFDDNTCQKYLYSTNAQLFKSKTEFLMLYDSIEIDEFLNLIDERENAIWKFERSLANCYSINLKNALMKNDLLSITIITQYRLLYYLCKYPVHNLIKGNKKLNKEYQNNGMYFSSESEFFEAYISGEYNKRLKAQKRH